MTSRPPSKLKQLLLRDQLWWRYYQRNADTIRPAVVDAISKVLACGRVIMGYASFVCSNHECSHTKKICFGCKARLCNTCGKKLTDQWIADQKALLPDTEWQHITFTMPDALWELFRINRTLLGKLECSYSPLCDPWRIIRRKPSMEVSLLHQKRHHARVALRRDQPAQGSV